MKIKVKDIFLYIMIATLFFWDILDVWIHNYLFIVLILLLLLFILHYKMIKIYKFTVAAFLYLFVQGIINIIIGNDNLQLFISQFISIFICMITYSTISSKYSIEQIFEVYWKSATLMSLFGILEIVLAAVNFTSLPFSFTFSRVYPGSFRFIWLASLCKEPTFLGYYLMPAVGLIVLKVCCPERVTNSYVKYINKKSALCIIVCYLMTLSATAYTGILIMFLLAWFSKGFSLKKILLPIIIIVILLTAYNNIPDIKLRIDDTLNIFQDGSVKNANLSTFTFYSNYTVMVKGFQNSFGLGYGLGAYPLIFDQYSLGDWMNTGLSLNREDGNSMFFRIAVELGIIGIVGVIFFLGRYFPKRPSKYYIFSCALIPLFVTLLLRQGNYTHGGIILFVCLYYRMHKQSALEVYDKIESIN